MLDAILHDAYVRYARQRPNSERHSALAKAFLPSGTTRSTLDFDPFPFAVSSAAGCWLKDIDGHEYLDYLGDYSVGLAGHNPDEVAEAVRSVLETGWTYGAIAADEAEVARLLCARFEAMDRFRFTTSGTEANLVAISLAMKSTGRDTVLVFDGGYHGGFLSFSRDGASLNVPFKTAVCDYNDVASVAAAFEASSERIACVVVEPMLGSGGRIQAIEGFLSGLRTLCDEHGAVLIFDEVQTSRMSHGGGQALVGVYPDITTLGKYIGGGLGFGAVGGTAALMGQLERSRTPHFDHSGTFNNSRFSMAASRAMLSSVLTHESLTLLFERGERLRKDVNAVLEKDGFQATGWGSLIGIHPTNVPVRRAADLESTDVRLLRLLFHAMLERGVFIGKSGFISLSLPQSEATDAMFLDALRESMVEISVAL